MDGSYMIGVYAIRDIRPNEELTFDYNSVTEVRERVQVQRAAAQVSL